MNLINNVIGYSASITSICITLPQTYKIIRTQSANDLSYFSIIISLISSFLWISYGILIKDNPIIVTDCVMSILSALQLICKIYYDKKTSSPISSISSTSS